TGLDATFGSTNTINLAGQAVITLTSQGLELDGDFVFAVTDTNGATAGGQVLSLTVTDAAVTLGTGGAKLTVGGTISSSFQISTNGRAGQASGSTLAISGATGVTGSSTTGTLNLVASSGTTVTVATTIDLTITNSPVSATLSGALAFGW